MISQLLALKKLVAFLKYCKKIEIIIIISFVTLYSVFAISCKGRDQQCQALKHRVIMAISLILLYEILKYTWAQLVFRVGGRDYNEGLVFLYYVLVRLETFFFLILWLINIMKKLSIQVLFVLLDFFFDRLHQLNED